MRFVILQHQTETGVHWDLMLEDTDKNPDALITYSFPPQQFDGSGIGRVCLPFRTTAKVLPPHRKEYLEYEGGISNNRGNVKRLAAGTFDKENETCYNLRSKVMSGTLTITVPTVGIQSAETGGDDTVILCYERKE